MNTSITVRPVAVEELRRAWRAVQTGAFRQRPLAATAVAAAGVPSSWTPAFDERVIPVVGAAGSVGSTTVALALATAAHGATRVVECCPAAQSGLAAASTAELGGDFSGWVRGSRGPVLLDRTDGVQPTLDGLATPRPAVPPATTIVDVGSQLPALVAGTGWVTSVLTDAPAVVLVARATVPGLRRLESALHLLGTDRMAAAVLGPPVRRWPPQVRRGAGGLVRTLLDTGRLVPIPEDRTIALLGLTPDPLPTSVLDAAGRLLTILKGTPS